MRLGRRPSLHDYRTLRFENYAVNLDAPPDSFDSKARVYQDFGSSDASAIFPMDGNDRYGDCTIAGRAHCDTIWNSFSGIQHIWTERTCLKNYWRLTGGVDSGLDMLTVMRDWQNNKRPYDNILAYVSVDPLNHVHMQQAIVLFGVVFVGFQCQRDIIKDFNAGKPWTPGPLINEGHAIAVTGYTGSASADMLNVLTWGSDKQQGQWAWWDEVAGGGRGECYAAVPKAAQNPSFAPGFDLQQLLADLQDVSG